MVKLNLGCGADYKPGWLNADLNPLVKADIRLDMACDLPFSSDSLNCVLLDNVVEHLPRARFFPFMDELHRVCASGARIIILAPHYSGMHALKHPRHEIYFGIGTFDVFRPESLFNRERYSRSRFETVQERLLFFHHNLVNHPFLSRLPINGAFNVSRSWQLLMERFQFLGFDEIRYELEVVK